MKWLKWFLVLTLVLAIPGMSSAVNYTIGPHPYIVQASDCSGIVELGILCQDINTFWSCLHQCPIMCRSKRHCLLSLNQLKGEIQ